MTDGMLSLSWNNHSTTFCHTLASLRAKERYTDVTLACDGKFYPVHKLVLSTCSEYFENMFEHTPCKHPVVVLRDVQNDELEALLSYMYAGVVSVAQSDLARLIKVAELLQIKGLAVPDEPPNSSKKAYNQRTSDDRTSPHLRSRHSYERNSPYAKSKQSQSSCDDGSSPHPKRRRRLESDTSHEDIQSTHNSPSKAMDGERLQEDLSAWNEDQDTRQRSEVESEERTDYHSTTQDPLTAKVQVNLDESLVKEEIIDDPRDSQNDSSEPGHNYDGMTGDSSGGGQDPVSLMVPKYDHVPPDQEMLPQSGLGQPPPLHEAVIEALAGPSGMQAWPGGGDMARRLALGEGFGGESNQDFTSLSLGQPSTQAHQLVEYAGQGASGRGFTSKRHLCPYCSYATSQKGHLTEHVRTHTGEKPYSCSLCPLKFSQKMNLKRHMRIHTGEKPFKCFHCPYRSSQGTSLKKHIFNHHKSSDLLHSSADLFL
ncbi:protein tramtrack, beta isoform-like isoform X4 [Homarus americanus]|uniref:protein tramtrack, beta isoform-like isoform X4 n=1 Tax=Homarus americanus TaxID=6706 RepID=UPI001C48AE92|nr:protein tramtrack, beta isoform-like isoform X4 [Homarus americanus]